MYSVLAPLSGFAWVVPAPLPSLSLSAGPRASLFPPSPPNLWVFSISLLFFNLPCSLSQFGLIQAHHPATEQRVGTSALADCALSACCTALLFSRFSSLSGVTPISVLICVFLPSTFQNVATRSRTLLEASQPRSRVTSNWAINQAIGPNRRRVKVERRSAKKNSTAPTPLYPPYETISERAHEPATSTSFLNPPDCLVLSLPTKSHLFYTERKAWLA